MVGQVGYRESRTMSVIGLAVNVASRLETLAKGVGVQIALTQDVADHAGLDCRGLRAEATAVRGTSAPLRILLVEQARDLLERLEPVALGA